jgi:hypothetical protein
MYMAALAIAEKLGGAEICGVGFPQWNIAEIAPPGEAAEGDDLVHNLAS